MASGIRGRKQWRNFLDMRPDDFDTTVAAFVYRFEAQSYKVNFSDWTSKGDSEVGIPGQVKIWHCLNLLDDAFPGWESRLKPYQGGLPKLSGPAFWETMTNWTYFADDLILRAGHLRIAKRGTVSGQGGRGTAGSSSGRKAAGYTNGTEEASKAVRFADSADKANAHSSSNTNVAVDSGLKARSADGDRATDYNEVINNGGFADDVYEDGDEVDGRVVVHVNGELRYAIPGYETRKKPRHTLITAPPFVIKSFFRQRFPGRPRCPNCRYNHPEAGYMLCSYCGFCHIGGDDECYHQHPHLRGTRPAKDKYIKSAESQPEAEAGVWWEKMMKAAARTGSGNAMDAVATQDGVEDLTASLRVLGVVETATKSPAPFVFTGNQDAETTSINFALALRPKASSDTIKGLDHAQSLSVAETAPSVDAKPVAASTPAAAPAANSPQLLPIALHLASEEEFANLPVATVEPVGVNGDGGVLLTAENVAQVPHDKSHRRWASMSSLTTSSSGASLDLFRLRRTAEVKEAALRKADKEAKEVVKAVLKAAVKAELKAAAEKVAAEKAAAKKAAAERASKVEAERAAEVNAQLRQEQIAHDRAAKEARWAAEDAARSSTKRPRRHGSERKQQRQQRQEREQEEKAGQPEEPAEQPAGQPEEDLKGEEEVTQSIQWLRQETSAKQTAEARPKKQRNWASRWKQRELQGRTRMPA